MDLNDIRTDLAPTGVLRASIDLATRARAQDTRASWPRPPNRRSRFLTGHDEIVAFLTQKWEQPMSGARRPELGL